MIYFSFIQKVKQWCLVACLALVWGCRAEKADSTGVETGFANAVEPEENSGRTNAMLIDAPSFTIAISGCISGYVGVVSEHQTQFNLYRNDSNCVGRLQDFVHKNKRYSVAPNKDFGTAQIGDSALFVSDDQQSFLTVRVTRQLSSPTRDGDSVNFAISETVDGIQKIDILKTIFGSTGGLTDNKSDPLRFVLRTSRLLQVVPANGAAQMAFRLECDEPIQNPGNQNASCHGIRMRDLSYVLIKDTANDMPCIRKNDKFCDKYFQSGSLRVDAQGGDIIAPNTLGLKNGGFRTKENLNQALIGPADMASNPNMLLILTDGKSFQWFNIDLKVRNDFYLTQLALLGLEESR